MLFVAINIHTHEDHFTISVFQTLICRKRQISSEAICLTYKHQTISTSCLMGECFLCFHDCVHGLLCGKGYAGYKYGQYNVVMMTRRKWTVIRIYYHDVMPNLILLVAEHQSDRKQHSESMFIS